VAAVRKKKVGSTRGRSGSVMGNDWIDCFPPDLFVCSRCGAEKKMGVGLPIMEQSFERTKAFNAAVDAFVGEHAACKEVVVG
jgi:hypothetical protein